MFGSFVKVLDNMGARLKPACSKHLAQFGEMLIALLRITAGQEAFDPEMFDQNKIHVPDSVRRGIVVVGHDAADRDTSTGDQVSQHRIQYPASDIVEIGIDAIGTCSPERSVKVSILV